MRHFTIRHTCTLMFALASFALVAFGLTAFEHLSQPLMATAPIATAPTTSEKAGETKPLNFLSFYSVHTPLMGRPDLVEKYKQRASSIKGPAFAAEEQVFGNKPRKVRILQKHAVYAVMVEAMDQAVGKVLKQLDESGVAENTVVIFTSDNGGLSTSEGSPTSNLP